MKVFISWSEERSRRVAELLRTWLKCVIQNSEPWASTEDIDAGSWWFTEIGNQLADTSIGIICLTEKNKNNPWILFEAGALTKGLSTSRVIPVFIDLKPLDLVPPLSQLNGVKPTQSGIKSLVRTINSSLHEKALALDVLDMVFNTYWPEFEKGFKVIMETTENAPEAQVRDDNDMLREVLSTVRGLDKRIRDVEQGSRNALLAGTNRVPSFNIDPTSVAKLASQAVNIYTLNGSNMDIIQIVSDLVITNSVYHNYPENYRKYIVSLILDELSTNVHHSQIVFPKGH